MKTLKFISKKKIIEVEDLLEDVDRSQSELKEKLNFLDQQRENFYQNDYRGFQDKFKKTKK